MRAIVLRSTHRRGMRAIVLRSTHRRGTRWWWRATPPRRGSTWRSRHAAGSASRWWSRARAWTAVPMCVRRNVRGCASWAASTTPAWPSCGRGRRWRWCPRAPRRPSAWRRPRRWRLACRWRAAAWARCRSCWRRRRWRPRATRGRWRRRSNACAATSARESGRWSGSARSAPPSWWLRGSRRFTGGRRLYTTPGR